MYSSVSMTNMSITYPILNGSSNEMALAKLSNCNPSCRNSKADSTLVANPIHVLDMKQRHTLVGLLYMRERERETNKYTCMYNVHVERKKRKRGERKVQEKNRRIKSRVQKEKTKEKN